MEEQQWPSDWIRGALSVCVLGVLEEGPSYGYAITHRLADAGLGSVKAGTLYPLLTRLETAGLVTVEWRPGEAGPGRKFFALTSQGRQESRRLATQWAQFAQITMALAPSTTIPG